MAIILSKQTAKSLLEWHPVNERIITARLRGRNCKMTIVQCYAPTNDTDDVKKDDFYDQLRQVLDKVTRHDLLIVMGDLNAKVGNE